MGTYRITTTNGEYEVETGSSSNPLLGAMETALSGPVGMPTREPGRVLNEAFDAALGGLPRNVFRYPKETLIGGLPAAQGLSTAKNLQEGTAFGLPGDVATMMKLRKLKPIEKSGIEILPSPEGAAGIAAGTILGSSVPFGGAIRSKVLTRPNLTKFSKYTQKAQKATSELLRVPGSKASPYLERGREHPAVVEISRIAKKSKNYDDLIGQTSKALEQYGARKRQIIEIDNFPIQQSFPDELRTKLPNDVIDALDIPKKNVISRVEAQAFKERIDDILYKFYGKRGQNLTPNEIAVQSKLANYRKGLAEDVFGGSEELRSLDSTYSGLKTGREFLADRAAEARSEPASNILSELFSHIRFIGSNRPHLFVTSGLSKVFGRNLESQTAKIAKLTEKASKYAPRKPYPTVPTSRQPHIEEGLRPRPVGYQGAPKRLEASPKHGEGFEILAPEVAKERTLAQARKFAETYPMFKGKKPDIEIPFLATSKKAKKLGFNEPSLKTAYRLALERRKRLSSG